jgi:hypothetical protein
MIHENAPHRHRWRDDELDYLRSHPEQPVPTIAAHLGRTVGAVRFKRWQLLQAGQLPKRPSRWDAPGSGTGTPLAAAEVALIENPSLTVAEIAQRTGRTPRAVAELRWQRGLRSRTLRRWTAEELAILEAMRDRPVAEVAAALDRSRRAIVHRRARLENSSENVED